MRYSTRELATRLTRYAHFLESEVAQYEAMSGVIDTDPDAYIGLARELKETREMVAYLYEIEAAI